ncbi:MAG: hypothetical protein K8W52_47055 [Deltaproteobacteria bacterium]|nr:hypothetical protein [Deltaproteobacteria bacterium]
MSAARLPGATAADRARDLHARLGIPADAARVLILCESSHWDPSWLLGARGYGRIVARILDRALDELDAEPARIYSVEGTYFLRAYWDARPAARARLVRHLASRRLRLAGGGVTSPDTVVAHGEAILRDYLVGARWLAERGLDLAPQVAYLPDSFGHSPLLPSLLAALGIDGVAFTRVDGMHVAGCDRAPRGRYPRPGSTAARLLDDERSLDLVWRDPAGGEVLAHWHAFGYGQGDLIAHRGLTRWMGLPLAIASRGERAVARRIDRLVIDLAARARTPYLLCPIGFDFVPPVRRLDALLARYNRGAYPTTGVWTLTAGLDDYLALVEAHRDALPVIALDPNPCFMGFPASRPALKAAYQRMVAGLLAAEAQAAVSGDAAHAAAVRALWNDAVVANHHDFVTGTSRAPIVRREQAPLVAQVIRATEAPRARPRPPAPSRPRWRWVRGELAIETAELAIAIDPMAGGAISARDRRRDQPWLAPGSLGVRAYHDDGGLWRLGHELAGGTFARRADTRDRPAQVEVAELEGALRVMIRARAGGDVPIELVIRDDEPELEVAVTAPPRRRTTWTVTTCGELATSARLRMAVPGGSVDRPFAAATTPTYWAADGLAEVVDATGAGTAILSALPLAVHADVDGSLRWIVHRHATGERADGWLPLVGFPVRGADRAPYRSQIVLRRVRAGERLADRIARTRTLRELAAAVASPAAIAGVQIDRPEIAIAAIKPAWRGDGVIVRLIAPTRAIDPVRGSARLRWPAPLAGAWLCDALERDRASLPVSEGTVAVPLTAAVISVRVIPARGGAR